MPESKPSFEKRLVAFAWSCWSEMGVSGWDRNHSDWSIDPEGLLLLTGCLGDADPRLRDESLDWCIRFHWLLSRARLRTLLKEWPAAENWTPMANALEEATGQSWPGASSRRAHEPSGRSSLQLAGKPALIGLRLRAGLGVGARTEILRILLLSEPGRSWTAAELAREAAYTKRNVAEVLDGLVAANFVEAQPAQNLVHYRMQKSESWRSLVGPLPRVRGAFASRCKAAWRLVHGISALDSAEPRVRSMEGRLLMKQLATDLRTDGFRPPPEPAAGEDAWEPAMRWAESFSSDLASGSTVSWMD